MPVKFSIVSYLNTLPFLYGIQHAPQLAGQIDLQQDIPSVCAQKLKDGTVDAGLVPVALLPHLPEYHIISDYCIGAVGKVKSVLLLSHVPLNKIERVMLDYQSRTSVTLVQVLAREYWKIAPEFVNTAEGFEDTLNGTTAAVIIGDRTFGLRDKYAYVYDLAQEWQNFTSLPFVFAVWASNKKLDEAFLTDFNAALHYGMQHKAEAAKLVKLSNVDEAEALEYFEKYISYELDEDKRKGLELFLGYLK